MVLRCGNGRSGGSVSASGMAVMRASIPTLALLAALGMVLCVIVILALRGNAVDSLVGVAQAIAGGICGFSMNKAEKS